ncbi:hypothetical protein AB7W88_15535 [Providencia vermicola]|uniref:Uncharacterized protein n=2 Tax=Providencia TaxID=586 RepID=A0AAI9I2W4_PROST|nr:MULTISPECIES: hypothetical protein [Providencia]ELR5045080.1 hypothetical protein [Providencia rettgeri]ELR5037655.1 hypothetical protein [Providencia stuartii]ELR5121985.1 hypothetical protein [Providencia stuartii]ELR5123480.1 hypothetical protein [Providencia stuartii]ELR5140749.1 hypothetical protein [Providencia stuartii]
MKERNVVAVKSVFGSRYHHVLRKSLSSAMVYMVENIYLRMAKVSVSGYIQN